MTLVYGQIESLKKLKEELSKKGITRFSSIGEINSFVKNYDAEVNEIPSSIKTRLDEEINSLKNALVKSQQSYKKLREEVLEELTLTIDKLDEESLKLLEKSSKNIFYKIFHYPKLKKIISKKSYYSNNLESLLQKRTQKKEHEVLVYERELKEKVKNKDNIISERCNKSRKELAYAKEVVDNLYAIIAGAIGEKSVVNEIQKLTDDYFLINDFLLKFNPPIVNKQENDKIFSIQIDHLLICKSGLFILETKNWSKQSLKDLDLRSPVEQIQRTSYALFVFLNSEKRYNYIQLERHHWGSKKIPIRNILVMTNARPKEEFKHVKVLSLKELNGYVRYFDENFNDEEVENIFNFLKEEMN